MYSETVWEFQTANFRVELAVRPEETDPADSFEFDDDIEAVRNGTVEWFTAVVTVYGPDGEDLGVDALGCCAYRAVDEFIAGHRDPDAMNRNSSVMRAAKGQNVCICHYFPDMVRQATADARTTLASHRALRLRAA